MPAIEATILSKILDGLIIIVTGGLVFVLRKLFKQDDTLSDHETLLALCGQRDKQREVHRQEDKQLRDTQRKEILDKIDSHHRLVMGKLDALVRANGKSKGC